MALPTLSAFSEEGEPLRMIQQSVAKDDPGAEGHILLRALPSQTRRHVDKVRGREACEFRNDAVPLVVLRGSSKSSARRFFFSSGTTPVGTSPKRSGRWLGKHNRQVKESGEGVRIVSCLLPKQSPWLNAIEPKWVHGKRRVVEFDGLLGAYELADRVCGAFGCPHHEHLSVPQEVA